MIITLKRFGRGKALEDKSTIGELKVNDIKVFTMEDDYDRQKVYGHTRIPARKYELKLRTWGKFHERYAKRFPEMHKGMIWLHDVPNYKYVLIHCGNTPEDTAGCILVGSSIISEDFISGSVIAYKKIYPIISDAILKERTFIDIYD